MQIQLGLRTLLFAVLLNYQVFDVIWLDEN